MDDLVKTDTAQSLAELRKLAKSVRSRSEWLEKGRRATPEEIALAESFREPNSCSAHSNRTGLPCEQSRIKGGLTCTTHGSAAIQVKKAAEQRLLAEVEPTLARMAVLRDQDAHLPTAYNASKDLLDRAGIGENLKNSKPGDVAVQVNLGIFAHPDLGSQIADSHLETIEAIDAEAIEPED